MKNTLNISIKSLEDIIKHAKQHIKSKSYLSETVEIEVCESGKYHNESDKIKVFIQSGYAECRSEYIWQNYN
jgi:hypothetical protein